MAPFIAHVGLAVPLPLDNVDTDVIVRMERCAAIPRDQLGPWAFEALRYRLDGGPDPSFPFNQPVFRQASVLVAGMNFGCGSSREMAVWALSGLGLRCVIAPSFGTIFEANCFQNGLLPMRLASDTVRALLDEAATGALVLEIDLVAQRLSGSVAGPLRFDVEPLRKRMLLEGLDELGLSMTHGLAIQAWQQRDRTVRPWIYDRPSL